MRVSLSSIWRIRLNTDRQGPSFVIKLLICGLQVQFASIVTRRYLQDCTRSTWVPSICNSTSTNNDSMVLLPASMSFVFFTFMAKRFPEYQSHIWLKSRAMMVWSSAEVDAAQDNNASSAYRITRAFSTAFGKLFIYRLNSNGPKMLPCGTPCVMAQQSDNPRFINTHWRLPARYDRNHLSNLEDSPRDSNFPRRTLWFKESNALEISRNNKPVTFPQAENCSKC